MREVTVVADGVVVGPVEGGLAAGDLLCLGDGVEGVFRRGDECGAAGPAVCPPGQPDTA
ncbi:hypothetical protein ACFQ1I_04685 [Kitasatospora arboriphila]